MLDGTCPATVKNTLQWQDSYEDWEHPGIYVLCPKTYGGTGAVRACSRRGD